jgi:hypothetical protein
MACDAISESLQRRNAGNVATSNHLLALKVGRRGCTFSGAGSIFTIGSAPYSALRPRDPSVAKLASFIGYL